MSRNNLIDRYIHEVGQHLPRELREDVQMELGSALQDMLEEQGLRAEAAEDQEQIAEVLKAFGHPETVAARYRPERYLVGPKLYPLFELVLKVVWGVISGIFVLGILVGGYGDGGFWTGVVTFFERYTLYLLYTLGVVVVVFAALQRLGVSDEEGEKDWDPNKLPRVEDPDRLNKGELLVEIFFTAAALVAFNYFFERIGIPGVHDGEFAIVSLLSDDLRRFVPWLSTLWAVEIGLYIMVLNQGAWQAWTRWAKLGADAAGALLLYRIINEAEVLDIVLFNAITKGILWVVLAISLIDIIGGLYGLLLKRRHPSRQLFHWGQEGE